MDGERIIAYTEKDLQEKAAQHICARIIKHQKSSSSRFLLGLSPTNGQARRNRAKEVCDLLSKPAVLETKQRLFQVYSAVAEWNQQEIDWGRVLIILLDERYGYEHDDDCNASLVGGSASCRHMTRQFLPQVTEVRGSLVKTLQKRGIQFSEEQLIAPDTSKGWKEAAEEYELRLLKLFQVEGLKGFSLVTTGLGDPECPALPPYIC
eukprot:symbB.v1.2.013926.t1/scaffold996.1/size145880/7